MNKSAAPPAMLIGLSSREIYDDISLAFGEKSPSYLTVKNWVARFQHLSLRLSM
jgi:hypothetical protein